jgi:pimeloyl-ACP methyl ester carboxylesterase
MTLQDSVAVAGQTVAYRMEGSGPPLVLLHGFLCTSRVWERQLADLSDRFTAVAWDAPGAGSSSDPPDSFSIGDWARCLAGFLDAVGIGGACVLGLSWGGMLAQELYRLYPERVEGLILAGTYAGWKGSLQETDCRARLERCIRDSSLSTDELAARWVPELFTDAAPQAVPDEMAAVLADFHPLGFRLMAQSLADTDTTDLLPAIDVPTLLLWGEDDERSPLSIAAQFHDSIPSSELAVIPGAGPVSNMERPEQFNDHVRRFAHAGG